MLDWYADLTPYRKMIVRGLAASLLAVLLNTFLISLIVRYFFRADLTNLALTASFCLGVIGIIFTAPPIARLLNRGYDRFSRSR